MKITTQEVLGAAILAMLATLPAPMSGQTNLNFHTAGATTEGAITLSWNSTPNEYYEIDYADSLVDTNTGSITWKLLYEDYPSQGTNTMWLDTGNYFIDPVAEHPSKSPMRFYRIVLSGTNTASAPSVSVTSPTNGSAVTDTIIVTVSASSDQPFLTTKLYVDGQEMQDPSSITNYASNGTNYGVATYDVNTCEWPNGPHTIFATAQCLSGPSGTHDVAPPLIGRAASTFVPVTYTNLITRVAFSEPFFMPEDGQTQRVSAVFAANVNWTLQIQDASSNTVRTATGSGGSMAFNWDGTANGGTNLPVGNYTYLITAQTNGQSLMSEDYSGGDTNTPPEPGMMSTASSASDQSAQGWYPTSAKQAVAAGWEFYYLRPPPMPPVRTNGVWLPWEDVFGPQPLIQVPVSLAARKSYSGRLSAGTATMSDATPQPDSPIPSYSGASSQSTRAPVRPPTAPTRGRAGYFGVAYDTYRGVASGYSLQGPFNGLPGYPTRPRVHLEDRSGTTPFTYPVLWGQISEARKFITEMKRGNWSMSFDRFDDALSIDDLRASGANIFNNVKLGLLLLHGTYGTSQDFTANGCQQMYFPITSGASAQYLRMSEMNLGSADTNGLKWMAISACNSLRQQNWFNMQNYGIQPWNGNLHLLLGTDSVISVEPQLYAYWARYMTRGKIVLTPMKIQDAWILAAQDAYAETGYNYTNTMFFAATGDAECQDDLLQTNSVPTGNPFYNSVQVWPRP